MSRPTLATVLRILMTAVYVVPIVLALISPMAGVWGGGKGGHK